VPPPPPPFRGRSTPRSSLLNEQCALEHVDVRKRGSPVRITDRPQGQGPPVHTENVRAKLGARRAALREAGTWRKPAPRSSQIGTAVRRCSVGTRSVPHGPWQRFEPFASGPAAPGEVTASTSKASSCGDLRKGASANVVTIPGAPWQCWQRSARGRDRRLHRRFFPFLFLPF